MLAEMDMSDDWLAEAHQSTSHEAHHQVAQVEYSRLAEQFHAVRPFLFVVFALRRPPSLLEFFELSLILVAALVSKRKPQLSCGVVERSYDLGAVVLILSLFSQAGYREGIDKGKRKCLQEGFDQGFSAGAMVGRKLGLLRGRATATLAMLLKSEEEDARVDRVRRLIRDLNRCDGGNLTSFGSLDEEMDQLTNSMDGLMDPAGAGPPEARPELEEMDLLAHCESELDAILGSMGILARSEST